MGVGRSHRVQSGLYDQYRWGGEYEAHFDLSVPKWSIETPTELADFASSHCVVLRRLKTTRFRTTGRAPESAPLSNCASLTLRPIGIFAGKVRGHKRLVYPRRLFLIALVLSLLSGEYTQSERNPAAIMVSREFCSSRRVVGSPRWFKVNLYPLSCRRGRLSTREGAAPASANPEHTLFERRAKLWVRFPIAEKVTNRLFLK